MPFTLSHPAIVLPLINRKWISATGIIAGSMVPDFEYFLRLRVYGIYGHTWSGLFWFDLPLALCLAYFFHYLVKPYLFSNLPGFLQQRWMKFVVFSWHPYVREHFLVVILSILAGAASHLLWDSFTHNHTFLTNNWSFLQQQVDLGFEDYPLWHILQQASTIIGLFFVLRFVFRMDSDQKVIKKPEVAYWTVVFFVILILMTWRLYEVGTNEIIKIGHVAVIGMGAACYALIVVSVIWRFNSNLKKDV